MRYIHRIFSLFGCLVLLWVAVSGTIVQSIDSFNLVTGTPETNISMRSFRDHKFGNNDYAVVTTQDFGARSLPRDFDYPAAFAQLSDFLAREQPGLKPQFVEVRMKGGRPMAQGGTVTLLPLDFTPVAALDLGTGAATGIITLPPTFPQPVAVRQRTMELHRFWISNDKIGGWAEIIVGILLLTLIVTGIIVYFRMLKLRTTKLKRGNWFWTGGSWWVVLHRWTSVVAAIFLIAIAVSGTWLGIETSYHSLQPKRLNGEAAPLSVPEIRDMARITVAAMRRDEPETPIRVMRLRSYAGMKQGVVVTGEKTTRQLVYNVATGKTVSLTEPGYPVSGFPLGMIAHETMKQFHSGILIGVPLVVMNALAGIALCFLTISGMVMYWQMWRKRAKAGRGALVWK